MTKGLAFLFVVAQTLDLATYLMLPPGAEGNPFVAWLGPHAAVPMKVATMAFVVWFTLRTPWVQAARALLLFGVAVGLIGFNANLQWLVR